MDSAQGEQQKVSSSELIHSIEGHITAVEQKTKGVRGVGPGPSLD